MESICEKNLTTTVLKLFENESRLFGGTDSCSWTMHFQKFIELVATHEVQNNETSLQLILRTLGPGPIVIWDDFEPEPKHTWIEFLKLTESK